MGDVLLKEFSRGDVKDFIDDMLDDNSREMTKKVLVSLKALLKEAAEREWIDTNPAAEVRMKRQSRHDKEAKIPTKDEIRRLLENAPARHRALIVTAIFTGMRISELRGLAWEQVDFDRRIITVRQRANRLNEIGSPKSRAGRRDIPMSPMVYNTLRNWRSDCPAGSLNLVFPNGAGNVESYGNLFYRFYKPLQSRVGIVDAHGVPKYGFHALRHAAASLMIEQGWNAKKVQTILGHSSINVTFDTYGHLFTKAEDDVELFEKMERDLMDVSKAA